MKKNKFNLLEIGKFIAGYILGKIIDLIWVNANVDEIINIIISKISIKLRSLLKWVKKHSVLTIIKKKYKENLAKRKAQIYLKNFFSSWRWKWRDGNYIKKKEYDFFNLMENIWKGKIKIVKCRVCDGKGKRCEAGKRIDDYIKRQKNERFGSN